MGKTLTFIFGLLTGIAFGYFFSVTLIGLHTRYALDRITVEMRTMTSTSTQCFGALKDRNMLYGFKAYEQVALARKSTGTKVDSQESDEE